MSKVPRSLAELRARILDETAARDRYICAALRAADPTERVLSQEIAEGHDRLASELAARIRAARQLAELAGLAGGPGMTGEQLIAYHEAEVAKYEALVEPHEEALTRLKPMTRELLQHLVNVAYGFDVEASADAPATDTEPQP